MQPEQNIPQLEGEPGRTLGPVAIVAARFNGFIVDEMVQGASQCLQQHGLDESQLRIFRVPGAFELPLAAQALADSGQWMAVIALGAVVRGATAHFDFVAGEAASGISRASLDSGCPVAFGVLTTDTVEQALERAEVKQANKGFEAALTALEMADLLLRVIPEAEPSDSGAAS